MKVTWVLLIDCLFCVGSIIAKGGQSRCEPISLELCSNLGYNETIYPNILKHKDQEEAGYALSQFYSLVWVNCSVHLKYLLCSIYAPMCSEYNRPFPPCRHLCEQAQRGCENFMNIFGFTWPKNLKCDQYPVKEEGTLCFGPDKVADLPESIACLESGQFVCPTHMTVTKEHSTDYSFLGADGCGAPCDEDNLLFWSREERDFAKVWIGCWSLICCISSLFTVLTYLIDIKRFLYPERPIAYLSGCYCLLSLAYFAGFALNGSVSCKQFHSSKVVIQGTHEVGCTVLFMLVYYFSMASSLWWVILTITWFLAAGLKWGNEAIEQKSPHFHTIAWTVPAVQTIVALLCLKVEGDVLSGVCFAGVYSSDHFVWTLLAPMLVYLLVGVCFLVAGFISMINIRNVIKHEVGTKKVEKLERLMVRIGIFSVLYTLPATVTIACHCYEHFNRDDWLSSWQVRNCRKFNIPCPCGSHGFVDSRPQFFIFIVKYFMTLIVGVTSGFWVWSGKTIDSWSNFKSRLFCRNKPKTRYHHGAVQKQQQPPPLPIVNNSHPL